MLAVAPMAFFMSKSSSIFLGEAKANPRTILSNFEVPTIIIGNFAAIVADTNWVQRA
jgi:hypothetical protein